MESSTTLPCPSRSRASRAAVTAWAAVMAVSLSQMVVATRPGSMPGFSRCEAHMPDTAWMTAS